MIVINPSLALDESEVTFAFIHASGPGGQNVNKVATAAQLRFDAAASPSLPEDVKVRLRHLAGRRMTKSGEVVILAQRFRSQERNRADALDRLLDLLRRAAVPLPVRTPTRPPAAARRERLADKRRRSTVKERRSRIEDE